MAKPRNDRNQAVTKFCLAMEEHRRTDAGRVRSAKEFLAHFFPHDDKSATDQVFLHMPNDVRGPILARWGIRGAKAALKDDAEKVKLVVHDALVAGDVDDALFEAGITPDILVDWIVLAEWWAFWRNGRLTTTAVQKALATARELGLVDDAWFLANVQARGGRLTGTDAVCETLTKDQIVAWIRGVRESGDASPSGLLAAIGWETVLARTAEEALLAVLDQLARRVGLAPEPRPKGDSGIPVAIPDIPPIDPADIEPPSAPSLPTADEQGPASEAAIPLDESDLMKASVPNMRASVPPPVPRRSNVPPTEETEESG